LKSARRVLSDERKLWPTGARERFSDVYVAVHHTDVNDFDPRLRNWDHLRKIPPLWTVHFRH